MAGINLDLSKTSATAVTLSLKIERDRLKTELESVERAIAQLEKVSELEMPEQTDSGRIKHGETRRAVMDYLLTVASPYAATLEEIVQGLGTAQSTTYKALKSMEEEKTLTYLKKQKAWIPSARLLPGFKEEE